MLLVARFGACAPNQRGLARPPRSGLPSPTARWRSPMPGAPKVAATPPPRTCPAASLKLEPSLGQIACLAFLREAGARPLVSAAIVMGIAATVAIVMTAITSTIAAIAVVTATVAYTRLDVRSAPAGGARRTGA